MRCTDTITLQNYGPQQCVRPAGHDGNHLCSSPYDSRDVYWTQTAEDDTIKGAWTPTGATEIKMRQVATVVNGFGRPVETAPLVITCTQERRPIWRFEGYETRWVES